MNNKIIWYLNPWDALPNESGFDRSLSIINKLSKNNFHVVWWKLVFHMLKKNLEKKLLLIIVNCFSYRE